MADPTLSEQAEKWEQVGEQIFTGAFSAVIKSDIIKFLTTIIADVIGALAATGVAAMSPIGIGIAKGIAKSEDLVAPALAPMAAAAVSDLFGVSVPASAFEGGVQNGHRKSASDALAAGLLQQLAGSGAALEPSGAAAERYVGVIVNLALEGWYQGWFLAFISHLIPELDIGKIDNFGNLDDKMSNALGLGRLSRRVLAPIVDAAIVTPLKWQTNKTYRPELLTESLAVRQYIRGKWSREQLDEELARQGWSAARIEAHINAQSKVLSLDEMMQLRRFGAMTDDAIQQALRDQGYDEVTAARVVNAKTSAALETIERSAIGAIQRAFINRNIELPEMARLISAIVSNQTEAAYYVTAASAERDVNVKGLSPAEARACVKAGILAVSDYRAALRQDGYNESAVLALELLLRSELEDAADKETERANALADRGAEKTARDLAAAARKADVAAERALHRRGALTDLEQAVVRGLIPIARYAEVLQPQYDSDTVQILVGLLEDDRLAYLAQQQRAEDARKRAGVRNIDVGALEQAVLTHVLTVDDFRSRLASLGFPADDADVLAATLAARLADAADAASTRAAAADAARRKSIDLGRYERLVLRGARTIGQYGDLLASLGFDDASRAGMVELITAEIADAAAARQVRADAAAKVPVKDVTLEQMRRGVILGVKTIADYEQYLIRNHFTTDAQIVLLAELRADVADAEAARQRRLDADAAKDNRALPLATVARAARLGLVLPGVYQRRLEADGFGPEDVEIDMTLLTFEIAETAAARAKRDAPPPAPAPKGLTLGELARAVKAGVRTVDDYQARAFEVGYNTEAVQTLVEMLKAELQTLLEAQAQHDLLALQPAREVSVSQLEQAVKAGLVTLDTYVAQLRALGFSEDVAALLAALLESKL